MRRGSFMERAACGLLLLAATTWSPGCAIFRPHEVQDTPVPATEIEDETEPTEQVEVENAPKEPEEKEPEETVPEIDQVSLVDAEPPEPRLLIEDDEKISPESLRVDVEEAERLSTELKGRRLTAEQRAQVEAGRGFLDDVREALHLQDLERAAILLDKCLALLRDAEVGSRI